MNFNETKLISVKSLETVRLENGQPSESVFLSRLYRYEI